jgi:hypothetical protein
VPVASYSRIAWIVAALHALPCSADNSSLDSTAFASASSFADNFLPGAALDGNRFSLASAWKGATNATNWWWQVKFDSRREIGAILQVTGDHAFVFRNAPSTFVWQHSDDGLNWSVLSETTATNEQRLFRLYRLKAPIKTCYVRLHISGVTGSYPTLREVEFYADARESVPFPDWVIAVNTTHDSSLPNHGQEFIPLARSCKDGHDLEAQQIWLDTFNESFLQAEPRPLCAFLSGNFKDWCQVDRETWRGTQEVLRKKNLPIWASCGGAQALAIIAESTVDKPWDCPHCRDPRNPLTPIYTHIGHTAARPCGDYSGCIFERGPHWVRKVGEDPVFRNLPGEFEVMQSHCGQIEWPPQGWSLIATAGRGSKTKTQCLRMDGHYIYAAQFHIEMKGTPAASQQIMANFLALSKSAQMK